MAIADNIDIEKWSLQNQPVRDLIAIAKICWTYREEQIWKLMDLAFSATVTPTALEVLWEEFPLKPDTFGDKRLFLQSYHKCNDIFGSGPGIMTIQTLFDLDVVQLVNLRAKPFAALYPLQFRRIIITWQPAEELARILDYLQALAAPARCSDTIHLVPYLKAKKFGRKFGRRFGR